MLPCDLDLKAYSDITPSLRALSLDIHLGSQCHPRWEGMVWFLSSSIVEPGVRGVDCVNKDVDIGWGEAEGMVSWVPEVEDELVATAGVVLMELLGVDVEGVGHNEGGETAT